MAENTEPLIETLREIVRMSVDRFAEIVNEEIEKIPERPDLALDRLVLHDALKKARKRWREEMTA